MPLVAPPGRRRLLVSPAHRPRLRPHPLAFIPLAAGFLGALALDSALGDRAEAAPVTHAPGADAPPAALRPAADFAPAATDRTDAAGANGAGGSGGPARRTLRLTEEIRPAAAQEPAQLPSPRDPTLEARLARTLVQGRTPFAATVLLEAHTGRVLAIAEHSTRGPAEGLAFQPMAPAASIFKIVTSSALLQSGVSPAARVCTHGGRTRMQPRLLVDDPKRDRDCRTFGEALPHSLNVAIAKLALKHLDPDTLRGEAARWGFAAPLPLVVAADTPVAPVSPANIPDDPFGFANTAAGFGDVKISALHGAVIASIVANQGVLVVPRLVDTEGPGPAPRRVIAPDVARKLQAMMTATVVEGTGRRAFATAPRLGVPAAGKTGSLADYATGLDTSWFVGFAPAERPEVIVASVVVNMAKWHVKAPVVAKEALRAWFEAHPPPKKGDLVATR